MAVILIDRPVFWSARDGHRHLSHGGFCIDRADTAVLPDDLQRVGDSLCYFVVFFITGFLESGSDVHLGIQWNFAVARYPLSMYPGWLRFILTWIVPVGIITTFPAQALTGELTVKVVILGIGLAVSLVILASCLFRRALRHYSSASS